MDRIRISLKQEIKRINCKVSDKSTRKLANTETIFKNGSDVMLKSFIAKKGTGSIRHLGGEMNRIGRRENWSPSISPSKNKPLTKGFEKYKPRGLFSEFYSNYRQ